MIEFLVIALLVVGLLVLVVGYRKNNRNMLLASALILLASGVGVDMVKGFIGGYQAEMASSSAS